MTVTQQLSPSSLRALKSSRYANGQASKMMLEAKAAKRITSQFMSKAGAKEAAKRIRKLKKTAKDTGEAVDGMLKTTKGKNIVQKGVAAGKKFGALAFIAGLVVVLAGKVITDIQIQNIGFDNELRNESEFQKAFQRYQRNVIDIRSLTKQFNDFKKIIDRNNKDLDSVSKEIFPIKEENRKILKQQNDITYEVRQGRKIVEEKIAQQARTLDTIKKDLAKALQGTKDNFQSAVNTTIKQLQTSLEKANSEISKANGTITALNDTVKKIQTTVVNIPKAIETVNRVTSDTVVQVTREISKAITAPARRWGVTVTPVTVTPATVRVSEGNALTVTPATVTPATVTFSDFSTTDAADYAREIQRRESIKQETINSTLAGGLSNVASAAQQATTIANTALQEAKIKGGSVDTSAIDRRIADTERKINADISGLKTEIGKIDRVNEQANRKLDDLIPKITAIGAALPLIPARAGDIAAEKIKPFVTPDAIANGVQTGMCRSLQGGCGKKAIDDAINDVKANSNSNTKSLLDVYNTGTNTADLALLGVINSKLGDQVPGGLSGKLDRIAKWLHLDRVLNVLIWWQTLHNAYMLSANLGQTLTSAISNVLAAVGIKDAEGSPLDIGEILGNQFDALAKSVVGVDEWKGIKAEFKKWNRIYQAAANLMNSIQSIGYSILSALEVVGSWVASIGNALRKFGEVGDNAYRWMNPTPNFQNKFFTTLENVENVVSQIDSVASEVLSVQETVTQIGQQKDELFKSLGEDDNSKQSTQPPEAAKVKSVEEESKRVSATGLAITDDDKEADE